MGAKRIKKEEELGLKAQFQSPGPVGLTDLDTCKAQPIC
jgi:hypothetical protein